MMNKEGARNVVNQRLEIWVFFFTQRSTPSTSTIVIEDTNRASELQTKRRRRAMDGDSELPDDSTDNSKKFKEFVF